MKRIVKFFLWAIVALVVVILAYSYFSFNFYSPADPEVDPDPVKLSYFHDSWEECHRSFLVQAEKMKERFNNIDVFSVPVESRTDTGLTIDFCYIPAKDTTLKLLILSSGTHGVEGFTGSAVQLMLMSNFFEPEMSAQMGILLIHGVNPWGFKNGRRVTENNVDLNRNFTANNSLFNSENMGFEKMYPLLTPREPLRTGSLENRFFVLRAVGQIMKQGMPAILQASLQGQYQFPEAIYFGGNKIEQQVKIMTAVFDNIVPKYSTCLMIDLHTGFGERGVLHLFPNPVDDVSLKQKMKTVFSGHQIDWGDSDNFYTVTGQFAEYLGKLYPRKTCIPMMCEFGTLNTSKTTGLLKSASISINENQGFHYGYKSEKDRLKMKRMYREMFYPSSEKWRTNAINVSRKLMEDAVFNYQKL